MVAQHPTGLPRRHPGFPLPRESRVVRANVRYPSRPPNSERHRLLPLAKLTEHLYYYKHMAHRSPCHSDQNHKATEATRCLMPENQKKTPRSRITKRNPDSKPNSDTTPASDGQTQRPEMAANGREIEFSKLTFRQQAALPRITLGRSWDRATPYGSLRSVIPAKAGIQG